MKPSGCHNYFEYIALIPVFALVLGGKPIPPVPDAHILHVLGMYFLGCFLECGVKVDSLGVQYPVIC